MLVKETIQHGFIKLDMTLCPYFMFLNFRMALSYHHTWYYLTINLVVF